MEKREQYKRLIMFFSSLIILAIQTGMFAYTWFHVYSSEEILGRVFWDRGNWALIAIYGVQSWLFSRVYGGYRVGYLKTSDVMYSQVLAILCTNVITSLLLALIARWSFGSLLANITPMLILTLLDIVAVFWWALIMRGIYSVVYPPRQLLMIHGDINPALLIRKMSSRDDKYVIRETVHIEEGIETIKAKIDEYHAVIVGEMPVTLRNQLIKYCYAKSVRCYVVPKLTDIMIMNNDTIDLFDTTLMLFRNRGLTVEQQFMKRLIDIVGATVLLVLFSPIMLISAIAVKCYDGGPILYKQARLTKDHRVFQIYKFRSMRVDSEKHGARLASKNDDRITPVGKILRRTHMDELPQILNILEGSMSIVGPRPERPELAEKYCERVPEFDYRLKVKAGLTGYAQVFGRYNTTPYDKLKLDLTYIEKYSVPLDIKLILLTVKIFFKKETSEGIEDGQTTALRYDDGDKNDR